MSSATEFVVLRKALKDLADASERLRALEQVSDEELLGDGMDDVAGLEAYLRALATARFLTR